MNGQNSGESHSDGRKSLSEYGFKRQGRKWWHSILVLIGIVGCGFAGVAMGSVSFTEIEKMRQLERTPQLPTSAVIAGEVNLAGEVRPWGRTFTSPDTGTECVYYFYRIEERQRDSDGNTRWVTIHTSGSTADFILRDHTGEVIVGATDSSVEIDAERKSRRREGSRRYTEYRIDPGDQIALFGYAEETSRGYRIGFDRQGAYFPVISWKSEDSLRHGRALASAAMVLGSVAFWLFAIFFLLQLFRVHQTALHLVLATMVIVSVLGVQGTSMIIADLRTADEAAHRMLEEGERVIETVLDGEDVEVASVEELGSLDSSEYQSLSAEDRSRISWVRTRMALSVERTNENLRRFPEVILGPAVGVTALEPLELPPDEQARIEELNSDYSPVRIRFFEALLGIAIGVIGTVLGTMQGLKRIKLKRTIENVPTSPTAGAVYGLTELKGRVEPAGEDALLTGPLSSCPCVYYRYLVREKKGSGKNSKWVTITDDTQKEAFYCRDESGRMLIDPSDAEYIVAQKRSDRRGRRRYSEWIIAPGEPVYALGPSRIHPDKHDELILGSDDDDTPFLVSSFTEREVMLKKAYRGLLLLNFGIVASMTSAIAVAAMVVSFSPMLYVTAAAISCSYLLVVLVLLYYNDLVFLRERVDRDWSNIDVALKKRFDLIGNLAEVVQEFLGHERQLQETVTKARRARRQSSHDAPDEREVAAASQARDQLLARVEEYPELRSREIVERLMKALRKVEDELALMRQGYNDSVERYNTKIDHFPEVLVARIVGFDKAQHLMAGAAIRRPPGVAESLESGEPAGVS